MTRYLFRFLCVCALGVGPLVGCSEAAQCWNDKGCDDQNACTDDKCYSVPVRCEHIPVVDWTPCDFDGLAGICIEGVCGENPCDDGNECTEDVPFPEEDCYNMPLTGRSCDWNGEPGVCIDGVCEEDPCKGVVCDDGDLCTSDGCFLGECSAIPVICSDRNSCTDDACDPETGECNYIPVPDGKRCCLVSGQCCDPFCYDCCTSQGECQNGECV